MDLSQRLSRNYRTIGKLTLFISSLSCILLAGYISYNWDSAALMHNFEAENDAGVRFNVRTIFLVLNFCCFVMLLISSFGMIKRRKWGRGLLNVTFKTLGFIYLIVFLVWFFQ